MTDAWPAGLPQRLQIDQMVQGKGDGTVEYAPDSGPSITRLATSAAMRPLSGYMILTGAQMDIFDTFFDETILGGSLPFTFPDPRSGDPLLVKFTKQSPGSAGGAAGMPTWSPLGGDNWQLNLVLAILP